jgi:hypothetical protein
MRMKKDLERKERRDEDYFVMRFSGRERERERVCLWESNAVLF